MISTEKLDLAHTRFLHRHPECRPEVDAVTEQDAKILGVSFGELRRDAIGRALDKVAVKEGVEPVQYLLALAADSPDELAALMAANRRAIDKAISG